MKNADRKCLQGIRPGVGYCGRRTVTAVPKAGPTYAGVTCTDCLAAIRADERSTE